MSILPLPIKPFIILGQQLAGNVKGHRVGTVLDNGIDKTLGHFTQRLVPGALLAVHQGVQQAPGVAHGFTQRHAFGAQPAVVRRVALIALNGHFALAGIDLGADTAAHATIGTGGLDAFNGRIACQLRALYPLGADYIVVARHLSTCYSFKKLCSFITSALYFMCCCNNQTKSSVYDQFLYRGCKSVLFGRRQHLKRHLGTI